MSIHVVAVITAKQGSEDVVRDALRAIVEPTRAEEGCVAYDLHESLASPGTFITTELWNEPSDLDDHLQADHVQAALTTVGSDLVEPPAVHPLSPLDVE